MEALNLFCTLEKLFLITVGLDKLLEDNYADLICGAGCLRRRTLSTLASGVSELHHSLEAFVMADPLCLATDVLERAFPVDNADDSGYDKHDSNT